MHKITKNTLCPHSKIKKLVFMIQYCISKQVNQTFEILGLYSFAFTTLAIDKIFSFH